MDSTHRIGILVEDLLFRSKIETTASRLKIETVALNGNNNWGHVAISAKLEHVPNYYSLVVLDLHLKGTEPVEWIRQFKQNGQTQRIPILAFFSHVEVDLKKRAVEAGCNMVVPRSVFSEQLPQLLARYV